MSEVAASLVGWVIGLITALVIVMIAVIIPTISQCERENALTEQQKCVLGPKVVDK